MGTAQINRIRGVKSSLAKMHKVMLALTFDDWYSPQPPGWSGPVQSPVRPKLYLRPMRDGHEQQAARASQGYRTIDPMNRIVSVILLWDKVAGPDASL